LEHEALKKPHEGVYIPMKGRCWRWL